MIAARFLVSGKVQGVWFRGSAREQALHLGLRGYARNLADGRVEVLVVGELEQIEAIESWLWQGPPLAKVESVSREDIEPAPSPQGFDTA